MISARLRTAGLAVLALSLLFLGAAWAQEKEKAKEKEQAKGEKKLELKDLPKAVQATVQKESQGATLVGLGTESEAGKTIYELETKISGHTRDLLIDAKGIVLEVEEETAIGSLPATVQAEVSKSLGKAKLVKLETVAKGGKMTGYSALVDKGGKQSEIEMGPDGKVLAKTK